MSKLSNTTQHNLATFGQLGSTAVSSGAITPPSNEYVIGEGLTGYYQEKHIVAITALAEATLSSMAGPTGYDGSFLSSVALPAGVTIYGKWTSVTTNAAVIAYFG